MHQKVEVSWQQIVDIWYNDVSSWGTNLSDSWTTDVVPMSNTLIEA